MPVKTTPQIFIDTTGDIEKSRSLIGFANNQRYIVNDLMKFNNLQQDQRKIEMSDGSVIIIQSCFGVDKIWISSPPLESTLQDEIVWKDVWYFLLLSGNLAYSFSWDVALNDYGSLTTNTGLTITKNGRYWNGAKVSDKSFPYYWNTDPSLGLDGLDVFRYWKRSAFLRLCGKVVSFKDTETGQQVTLEFTNSNTQPNIGAPIQLGEISPATTERLYDINAKVIVGDFLLSTGDRSSGGAANYSYGVITGIVNSNTVYLDRPVFSGDMDNVVFEITPTLPIYTWEQTESSTTYIPDDPYIFARSPHTEVHLTGSIQYTAINNSGAVRYGGYTIDDVRDRVMTPVGVYTDSSVNITVYASVPLGEWTEIYYWPPGGRYNIDVSEGRPIPYTLGYFNSRIFTDFTISTGGKDSIEAVYAMSYKCRNNDNAFTMSPPTVRSTKLEGALRLMINTYLSRSANISHTFTIYSQLFRKQ